MKIHTQHSMGNICIGHFLDTKCLVYYLNACYFKKKVKIIFYKYLFNKVKHKSVLKSLKKKVF